MTTLQNLIDQCEQDLSDEANSTFSAAAVEQWCRDAISDYSQHFPRTLTDDITTALDDRQYDLPTDFHTAVSVEYPEGEDPPKYLYRRPSSDPYFWNEDGFFAVLHHADAEDPDELMISTKPAASETIQVTYQAAHDNTIDPNDALTVPIRHDHLLRSYVLWRAELKLKAAEEASPTSNSSLLMSQFAVNADRLRRAYVDALAKAVYAESKSSRVSWQGQAEETTRIY